MTQWDNQDVSNRVTEINKNTKLRLTKHQTKHGGKETKLTMNATVYSPAMSVLACVWLSWRQQQESPLRHHRYQHHEDHPICQI